MLNYKPNAVTPLAHDLLGELIAKKTQKVRLSEKTTLCPRPKTVNKLKTLSTHNKSAEKPKETPFPDLLPKYLTTKAPEFIGDFELGPEIGKGSYGTVRLCTHCSTGEKVAIKSYYKSDLLHPSRKKAVEREIKILQKLQHPNIIRLLNTIENSSSIHLILEYVSGCSLLEYLRSRSARKLEETQAKNIFRQVLITLEFCHSLGITHRDIKLENVLLQENHCIKIIDFGLSTYCHGEKKVKIFCGTMTYMAPEIIMGKEAFGPPTDVWAATVMLFVMITGTFPFKGMDSKELCSKIQRRVFVMPLGLSFGVKKLFKNVFEADEEKRMTVAQLLADPWMSSVNQGNSRTLTCINHFGFV